MNRTSSLSKLLTATMMAVVSLSPSVSAVDKGKALYVGGTLTVKEKAEGPIDIKGSEQLVFSPKKEAAVTIPWANVSEVEYGQKAGRRIKTAIFLSPLALFGKSRHHYVTLSYRDVAGADQAAVFEFDKDDIRPTLAIIRARTGKDILMQDEEAQKQMGGSAKPSVAAAPAPAAAAATTTPAAAAPAAELAAPAESASPAPAATPAPQR